MQQGQQQFQPQSQVVMMVPAGPQHVYVQPAATTTFGVGSKTHQLDINSALCVVCFVSLSLSYLFSFICEQLKKDDAQAGIALGIIAMVLSFPVPIAMFYPILNDKADSRREHFAIRVCIAILLYVGALIMSIVTVIEAMNDTLTTPGIIVTSAGMLVISSLILYLDHPQNPRHHQPQQFQNPQQPQQAQQL